MSAGSSAASASRASSRSDAAQSASANRSQAYSTASTNRATTQQSRQSTSTVNQAQRQDSRSQNQSQRQQYSNENVETRQQGATSRSQNRQEAAQSYQGNRPAGYYPPSGQYDENNWDDGEVAAVAVGAAAIGAMAGYAAGESNTTQSVTTAPAPSTTVVYAAPPAGNASLPCSPNTSEVNGVTYYQCGSDWYTQAYGSNGVIYQPVPAPY